MEATIAASALEKSPRPSVRHQSPPLGVLATAFTILKLASIACVSQLASQPPFPAPQQPGADIVSYFRLHPSLVLACAFLQVGAAIPLGLFAASTVSRLRFLGVQAAGATIALFGGLAAAFDTSACAAVLWTAAHGGVAADASLLQGLYYLAFALGGPGYSMPLGILMAGVSVPALIMKLMPRWISVLGLALAVIGELSWLSLIVPGALFLVPLTRFPGFVWLIAAGFALPATRPARPAAAR
ncbi:MAG TPA: hypothetical protein VMW75_25440 [Thermoanaerobaculia bacterium]|nr:hypothetical protein [Thermoanaerobaculia bacterium]